MKSTFLFLFVIFISFSLLAQEKVDTIICGNYRVIIQVPEFSLRHAKLQNYEEGFFKIYPSADSSYLLVHYGSMMTLPFLRNRGTCDSFKIGNIGSTIRGINKDKLFREDRYENKNIIILYENINKSKGAFYNSILDNVRIELLKNSIK